MKLTQNEINQKLSIIYHFSRENDVLPHFSLSISLFIDHFISNDIGRFGLGTVMSVKKRRQHPIPIYISCVWKRIKFISHPNNDTVYSIHY